MLKRFFKLPAYISSAKRTPLYGTPLVKPSPLNREALIWRTLQSLTWDQGMTMSELDEIWLCGDGLFDQKKEWGALEQLPVLTLEGSNFGGLSVVPLLTKALPSVDKTRAVLFASGPLEGAVASSSRLLELTLENFSESLSSSLGPSFKEFLRKAFKNYQQAIDRGRLLQETVLTLPLHDADPDAAHPFPPLPFKSFHGVSGFLLSQKKGPIALRNLTLKRAPPKQNPGLCLLEEFASQCSLGLKPHVLQIHCDSIELWRIVQKGLEGCSIPMLANGGGLIAGSLKGAEGVQSMIHLWHDLMELKEGTGTSLYCNQNGEYAVLTLSYGG